MKYSITDIIVSVLSEKGPLRYGELKTIVKRYKRKRSISLSEGKFVEALGELIQKAWMLKNELGRNHVEYSLTDAGKKLCELGLIGINAERERWQFYRFLFFAERENIGKDVKGFSETDVFHNIAPVKLNLRRLDKINKKLQSVFRYLHDEGIIRVADVDEEETRYVISDSSLRWYVDNIWKLFFHQLAVHMSKWEYGEPATKEEQKKLEIFLGKTGAVYAIASAKEKRKQIRNSNNPAILEAHLKEQQKWEEYAYETAESLRAKRSSLLQHYPHLLTIIEGILLESVVK